MVPLVLLLIDIVPLDQSVDEKGLRSAIEPCLNRLKALKGSFDRKNDIVLSVRPYVQDDGRELLTARIALSISVGKERAQHLLQVFDAYAALLRYELPDYRINSHQEILKFL